MDMSGALLKDESYNAQLQAAFELGDADAARGRSSSTALCAKALRSRYRLVAAGRADVDAHVLASERGMAETHGRFVGRKNELRQVGEALGRAHQGRLQIIGLHGEAGAGKSRLLMETMRRLGLAGHNVGLHLAPLTPQMREVPLSAIQEMLRVVLGVDEFDPEPLVRGRTTRLRELGLLSVEQSAVAAALGVPGEAQRSAPATARSRRRCCASCASWPRTA